VLPPPYAPVTAEEAEHNARMLDIALREHGQGRKRARRDLAAETTGEAGQ
jgi:hypothetical protein